MVDIAFSYLLHYSCVKKSYMHDSKISKINWGILERENYVVELMKVSAPKCYYGRLSKLAIKKKNLKK